MRKLFALPRTDKKQLHRLILFVCFFFFNGAHCIHSLIILYYECKNLKIFILVTINKQRICFKFYTYYIIFNYISRIFLLVLNGARAKLSYGAKVV